MPNNRISRRKFIAVASVSSLCTVTGGAASPYVSIFSEDKTKPAILGGQPIRSKPFPRWPVWDAADEEAILPVLRSGIWSRNNVVKAAETKFARVMGTKRCLLTFCGTQALITALHTVGVGGGDEVIVTPYTFVATIDAILMNNALPVFADVDPETWSIDPQKIKEKINSSTHTILPVHIGGSVCQMDDIMQIAREHGLKVVEDACQAHMSEWRNQKVGSLGDFGCFSLQNSKVITCGEGGAIIGNDDTLMDHAYSFHNFGRPFGSVMQRGEYGYTMVGTKCRISEFQASILSTQMDTSNQEIARREENAKYLAAKLNGIPGIVPRKEYQGTTRISYHYFGFRYKKEMFDGLPRDKFMQAINAEGIPISKGLGNIQRLSQNREGCIEAALNSKTYQAIYSQQRINDYRNGLSCPHAEQLVQEMLGFSQKMLLGTKKDMDDIADAVLKIYDNRKELVAKI